MRIVVSGASGLIGTRLVKDLNARGHNVVRLTRKQGVGEGEIFWDPGRNKLDYRKLEGFDAVIHLSGENIAGRWTAEKKAKIRDSRVNGTSLLVRSLIEIDRKPEVLLSASAIGIYGDRGSETITEDSHPGVGFLSGVCQDWEAASLKAEKAGIRTVNLRIGVVLSTDGGALGQMLPAFKLGAGGKLGSGRQYFSWVSIDDVVGAIEHCLNRKEISGPVNIVSPNPVSNQEFTEVLGRVLGRPTIFPVPDFAVRLGFGEMGEALLLAGQKVMPARLEKSGYKFLHPRLEDALRNLLE